MKGFWGLRSMTARRSLTTTVAHSPGIAPLARRGVRIRWGAIALGVGSAIALGLPAQAGGGPMPGDQPTRRTTTTTHSTPASSTAHPNRIPITPAGIAQTRQQLSELAPPARFPMPATRIARSERVTVRLVNLTNAKLGFQVLGTTNDRLLTGILDNPEGATTVLERLPVPVNLVFDRQDGGFVLARPIARPDGVLEIVFEAVTDFDLDSSYVNIDNTGAVYLY